MNRLQSAFKSLFASAGMRMKPIYYPDGKSPRARNDERHKSGKTRRGATHRQGAHFLGRRMLNITPAQYRHFHVANPEKAAREKMKAEKKNG